MTAQPSFRCTQCQGVLLYSPSQGALRCAHCRAVQQPQKSVLRVEERDLQAALKARPETEAGPSLADLPGSRVARCRECGAQVVLAGGLVASACAFCRSPTVLAQAQQHSSLRPDSLIPFQIDRGRAQQIIHRWVRGLRFRPSDLVSSSQTQRFFGIYVPYYTFDAQVESSWSGEAGYAYTETETYEESVDGQTVQKTREVKKMRWESRSGTRRDTYDDLLIGAGRGLTRELAAQVDSFRTGALLPYAPEYLVGFLAEESSLDLATAWRRGESSIRFFQEQRCQSDVGGDEQRNVSVDSTLSKLTYKQVLLPFWVLSYRYRDRSYRIVVNGQSGELAGEAPYAKAKILALVLALVVALLLAYAYVVTQVLPSQGGLHP